jgi:hypothetical protein
MKLVDDQRAALGILAASVRGRTESLMQAHGFAIGMLRGLVRDGLATALRETAYYNRRAVLVTVMQITDAGREELCLDACGAVSLELGGASLDVEPWCPNTHRGSIGLRLSAGRRDP